MDETSSAAVSIFPRSRRLCHTFSADMEVFMQDIGLDVQLNDLKRAIAAVLHNAPFKGYQQLPINFEVSVFPPKAGQCRRGALTVPSHDIGRHFLRDYGGPAPGQTIVVCGQTVRFTESKNLPRPATVDKIRLKPYVDPDEQKVKEDLWADLKARIVSVSSVQFGWECRDHVYSIEYEKLSPGGSLSFDAQRREFRVRLLELDESVVIVIRAAQVAWASLGQVKEKNTDKTVLFLSLLYAPAYESDLAPQSGAEEDTTAGKTWTTSRGALRQRRAALNHDHQIFAMYTSLALRIVCEGQTAVEDLKTLCAYAHIKRRTKFMYPIDRGRLLFAPEVQRDYSWWLESLDWELAFQVDVLARDNIMDLREIQCLKPQLTHLAERKSTHYLAAFVRHLAREARDPAWYRGDVKANEALHQLFRRCRKDFIPPNDVCPTDIARGALQDFDCMHAIITPTTIRLEGPFSEQCNRVIREYAEHSSSFMRVRFTDEARLQCRSDPAVDYHAFIHDRFGRILQNGFSVAGRRFNFLGYSNSGIKQHSMWFVKDFTREVVAADGSVVQEHVTAESIVAGLGDFDNNPYDPQLMECPARYGARIAQSFSATQAFATVKVDEIRIIPDITNGEGERPSMDVIGTLSPEREEDAMNVDGERLPTALSSELERAIKDAKANRSFTDGIGTLSPELAQDIWEAFRQKTGKRLGEEAPAAFQIRLQGAKGMLSRDPSLTGRVVCVRPSMIKYSAPRSTVLEIAGVFHRPRRFQLNRPLVMLLEELSMAGGYDYLQSLQQQVKDKTEAASESLHDAAQLFDTAGLGANFALPTIFQELADFGITNLTDDFTRQVVSFSKHHTLRELKYHARIPIPGGYNLVGVADIHGYLEEGQIFVCVVPGVGKDPVYLKGPTMVARSPVIHRGDVQVVVAIGPPPPGSPFEIEPHKNTIVFSTRGSRPLPSYLGGGDLDGDDFVVADLAPLLPRVTYQPANYEGPPRTTIGRRSTLKDVAAWVTEYLYSDTVGQIATNWLTIADQSPQGVLAPDSQHGNTRALERLAEMHSDAVDYVKSGTPVLLRDMPRSRISAKPDWSAPEMQYRDNLVEPYYESQRWIGKLSREIKLSPPEVKRPPIDSSKPLGFRPLESVVDIFRSNKFRGDSVEQAVRPRVARYVVSVHRYSSKRIESMWRAYKTYVSALRSICVTFSLVQRHGMMLTEEEVVVGTIVAQSTQPRVRKEKIAQMRDQVASLVARTGRSIVGLKEDRTETMRSSREQSNDAMVLQEGDRKEIVKRAWVAFRISTIDADAFGSRSFGLIALRELLDALKSLDEASDDTSPGTITPDDR